MNQSHKTLQKYLMCSFAYYILLDSLVEDTEYDQIARYLLEHFDEWQDHQHAYLVTKGDLTAGTLYRHKYTDYPAMVIAATDMWSRKLWEEQLDKGEV